MIFKYHIFFLGLNEEMASKILYFTLIVNATYRCSSN